VSVLFCAGGAALVFFLVKKRRQQEGLLVFVAENCKSEAAEKKQKM
jgi:hypothetical protein